MYLEKILLKFVLGDLYLTGCEVNKVLGTLYLFFTYDMYLIPGIRIQFIGIRPSSTSYAFCQYFQSLYCLEVENLKM